MSKTGIAKTSIMVGALILLGAQASAQRTAKGEAFISAGWAAPLAGGFGNGAHLDYGRYGLDFYWKAGVGFQDYRHSSLELIERLPELGTVGGRTFDYAHCTLQADFMYRLAGTYSRRLNLYAGGGAMLGMGFYGLFKAVPSSSAGKLQDEFIYGIRPSVEVELFVLRRIALTVGASLPITPGTALQAAYGDGLVHLVGSAGLRFNF